MFVASYYSYFLAILQVQNPFGFHSNLIVDFADTSEIAAYWISVCPGCSIMILIGLRSKILSLIFCKQVKIFLLVRVVINFFLNNDPVNFILET